MLYDALHTTLVFLFNLSKLHESVQGLARLSLHLADMYPTFFLFIPLYIPLHRERKQLTGRICAKFGTCPGYQRSFLQRIPPKGNYREK